jgi:hypothetical protein
MANSGPVETCAVPSSSAPRPRHHQQRQAQQHSSSELPTNAKNDGAQWGIGARAAAMEVVGTERTDKAADRQERAPTKERRPLSLGPRHVFRSRACKSSLLEPSRGGLTVLAAPPPAMEAGVRDAPSLQFNGVEPNNLGVESKQLHVYNMLQLQKSALHPWAVVRSALSPAVSPPHQGPRGAASEPAMERRCSFRGDSAGSEAAPDVKLQLERMALDNCAPLASSALLGTPAMRLPPPLLDTLPDNAMATVSSTASHGRSESPHKAVHVRLRLGPADLQPPLHINTTNSPSAPPKPPDIPYNLPATDHTFPSCEFSQDASASASTPVLAPLVATSSPTSTEPPESSDSTCSGPLNPSPSNWGREPLCMRHNATPCSIPSASRSAAAAMTSRGTSSDATLPVSDLPTLGLMFGASATSQRASTGTVSEVTPRRWCRGAGGDTEVPLDWPPTARYGALLLSHHTHCIFVACVHKFGNRCESKKENEIVCEFSSVFS